MLLGVCSSSWLIVGSAALAIGRWKWCCILDEAKADWTEEAAVGADGVDEAGEGKGYAPGGECWPWPCAGVNTGDAAAPEEANDEAGGEPRGEGAGMEEPVMFALLGE